ncbi:MAG: hybrid sensor histidine kinase/response regulator [Alphaproteobacteria bacterium]
MDDLLAEFLTETSEAMDLLDVELVKLEQDPNDPDLLGNIFRMVHTVKGTCGFLGLPRLEAVAHASENVLGRVREGKLEVTPYGISLVLQSLDQIKAICAEIEQNEEEPEGNDAELIAELNALAEGKVDPSGAPIGGEAAAEPAPEAAPEPAAASEPAGETASDGGFPVAAELLAEYEEATGEPAKEQASDGGFPVAAELLAEYEEATGEPAKEQASDGGFPVAAELLSEYEEAIGEPVSETAPEVAETAPAGADVAEPEGVEAAPVAVVAEPEVAAKAKPAKAKAGGKASKEKSVAAQSIRVNVDVLENLMTMVSELVLTRNQLMQIHRANENSDDFAAPLQTLNHIVSELQEGVMQTRMQPIGNAWSKLPRIIRDLSLELGKKIDLQMLGQETELDRQVLEMIRDPLTHMVRNSGDHAIETPAERRAAGKTETGTVTLNAFHQGGHIIIEVKDDGRGLAVDKIKKKILDNELASESELADMADTQIQQFIFKAGFSTAAKVTSVSGRGVGMDVVRTNIEKIGGTVELQSTEGKGTVFTIKIPLTLAIVSALIVECAGDRFAIPQISVLELVRASAKSETRIEFVKDSPVLRLRDRLLPLVSLRDLLGLEAPRVESPKAVEPSGEGESEEADIAMTADAADTPGDAFIIVTQVGANSFGMIVDRVFDTEEIVVKPVAPILRDIPLFSGNTILGDGSVIMILDPIGIAAQSGENSLSDSASDEENQVLSGNASEKATMLIFRAVDGAPKAVPLALVARLEEFDVEGIEQSNSQAVVQYRGQLMPLVMFNSSQTLRDTGRQPVLVFTEETRTMGLVVDEIIDIIETELVVNIPSEVPGMVGSAIIAEKATDVVDTGYYLTLAYPDWFKTHGNEAFGESTDRLLLVDDSAFFRNMITPLLQVAGYDVTTADSATQALGMCEAGAKFDLIISDIEMPGMSGFEFTEKIRAEGAWKDVPVVALTSHTAPKDIDRGRKAGFTDYVGKSDRDALLRSVSETLALARGAA